MDFEQKELGEMLERVYSLTQRMAQIWAEQLGPIDEREVLAAAKILQDVMCRRALVHRSFTICTICIESQRVNRCMVSTWTCEHCYTRACEHLSTSDGEQHILCADCYKRASSAA